MKITKIHCPDCGHTQKIEVPQDKCLQFYLCEQCDTLVQNPEGSCCVICAYAEINCPVSTLSDE